MNIFQPLINLGYMGLIAIFIVIYFCILGYILFLIFKNILKK
mgnify:FL=1|jgi:hypothetical protein|nr:MAG TPA: hypothetical protein [Caudoviricetes sp.]